MLPLMQYFLLCFVCAGIVASAANVTQRAWLWGRDANKAVHLPLATQYSFSAPDHIQTQETEFISYKNDMHVVGAALVDETSLDGWNLGGVSFGAPVDGWLHIDADFKWKPEASFSSKRWLFHINLQASCCVGEGSPTNCNSGVVDTLLAIDVAMSLQKTSTEQVVLPICSATAQSDEDKIRHACSAVLHKVPGAAGLCTSGPCVHLPLAPGSVSGSTQHTVPANIKLDLHSVLRSTFPHSMAGHAAARCSLDVTAASATVPAASPSPVPATMTATAASLVAFSLRNDAVLTRLMVGPAACRGAQVSAGKDHTCALGNARGEVFCWGKNDKRQLGLPNIVNQNSPQRVQGLVDPMGIIFIAAGDEFACALYNTGKVACWGTKSDERLGDGSYGDPSPPMLTNAMPDNAKAVQLSLGEAHACVALDTGGAACWGKGEHGRLGNGGWDNAEPSAVLLPLVTVQGLTHVQVAVGGEHACALVPGVGASPATAFCWGSGSQGQTGRGSSSGGPVPQAVDDPSPDDAFVYLSAGRQHTCGLRASGLVWCWGFGDNGQLGAPGGSSNVPIQTSSVPGGQACTMVAAGFDHTCAVLADGTATCWGKGGNGRLGNANTGGSSSPKQVRPFRGHAAAIGISLGEKHSCAALDDGNIACWGDGGEGRLGDSASSDRNQPAHVQLPPVELTARHYRFMCLTAVQTSRGSFPPVVQVAGHMPPPPAVTAPSPGVCFIPKIAMPAWMVQLFAVETGKQVPCSGTLDSPGQSALAAMQASCNAMEMQIADRSHIMVKAWSPLRAGCVWPDEWSSTAHRFVSHLDATARSRKSRSTLEEVLTPSSFNWLFSTLSTSREMVQRTASLFAVRGSCSVQAGSDAQHDLSGAMPLATRFDEASNGFAVRIPETGAAGSGCDFLAFTDPSVFALVSGAAVLHEVNSTVAVVSVAPYVWDLGLQSSQMAIFPRNASGAFTLLDVRATSDEFEGTANFGRLELNGGTLVATLATELLQHDSVNITLHDCISGDCGPLIVCARATLAFKTAHCQAPPGSGRKYVQVAVNGGLFTSNRLPADYVSITLEGIQPRVVLLAQAPSAQRLSFNISGSRLGNPAEEAEYNITVAGAPCQSLGIVSQTLVRCAGVDPSAFTVARGVGKSAESAPVCVHAANSSICLEFALQVTTDVFIFGVNTSSVSVSGGWISVAVGGLGRVPGPDNPELGLSGDVQSVTLGTDREAPIACGDIVIVSSGTLECLVPAGTGALSPVQVVRMGGIASTAAIPLSYDSPRISRVIPAFVFASRDNSSMHVSLLGENFGQTSPGVPFMATLAGAECTSVEWRSNFELLCKKLPLGALDADSEPIVVQHLQRTAVVNTAAKFEVVPLLAVASVLPAQVSVAGGVDIDIFGEGLAPAAQPGNASYIAGVFVGQGECTGVVVVNPKRIKCTVPDAAEASGISGSSMSGNATEFIADVTVRMFSGVFSVAPDAVTYVLPNIILVTGSDLLAAKPSGNASQVVSFSGNELVFDSKPPVLMKSTLTLPLGSISADGQQVCEIGADGTLATCGVQCTFGTMRSDSTTSSGRVSCTDFQLGQLATVLAPGISVSSRFDLTLANGVNVSSDAGTVRLQGPPVLTAVVPAAAEVGDSVTVQGACLGYAKADIASVAVGGVTLDRETWAWTGPEAITINSLPPPRTESADDSQNVVITVVTRTSLQASLPRDVGFSWLLPPRPPVTPPMHPCSYRDESGAAHIMALWPAAGDVVTKVSPVVSWAVATLVLQDGQNAPAQLSPLTQGSQLSYVQVIAADSSQIGNSSELQQVARTSCPHTVSSHIAGQHVFVDVTVRRVPVADSATPLVLAMAANTDAFDDAMNGPFSAASPVLFARCQAAQGTEEQYLATQGVGSLLWKAAVCQPCPAGARCRGLPMQAMTNLPGWQRAEWDPLGLTLVECANADSCPVEPAGPVNTGVKNAIVALTNGTVSLPAAFVDPDGIWVPAAPGVKAGTTFAARSTDQTCTVGHTGHLCGRCALGFARAAERTCRPCASSGLQWLSLLGGILLGGGLLTYLIRTTLNSAGDDLKPFVALNKLMFSHLQQIAIAASFPMKWPAALLSMFSVFNTSASISSDLISVDCFEWSDSALIAGAATQLLLPFFVLLILVLYWSVCRAACRRLAYKYAHRLPVRCRPAAGTVKLETSAPSKQSCCAAIQLRLSCCCCQLPSTGRFTRSVASTNTAAGPAEQCDLNPDELPELLTSTNPLARPMPPKCTNNGETTAAAHAATVSRSVSRGGGRRQQRKVAISFDAPECPARPPVSSTVPVGVTTGLVVSVLVSCFVLHLSLSKTSLSLLTCVQLAPGHSYLLGDLDIACNSARGIVLASVGSAGLVLYGFGIPLGSFLVLWYRRKRLDDAKVKAKYGFLYNQYKPATWYWETVTLLRKVVLALIAVLLATQGTGVQVTASIVLLVGCLVAHMLYLPHKLPLLNTVEAASLTVAVVTLAGGAILVDNAAPDAWKSATTIFVVAINALFLAGIVWRLFQSAAQDTKLKAGLQRLKSQASLKRASFAKSQFASAFRWATPSKGSAAKRASAIVKAREGDSKSAPAATQSPISVKTKSLLAVMRPRKSIE